MGWQKVDLSVLRHPRLITFRSSARCHILEFVELSVRYGRPGVVDLYDDEIARDLRMGAEDWLDLRDDMLLRKLIRVMPGPPRIYELAFWLLPDQTAAPRGDFPGIVDGRAKQAWPEDTDTPDLLELDSYAGPRGRPSRSAGALTAAERQAVRRGKMVSLRAGERFDRNACLEDYRARKAAKEDEHSVRQSPPERHETGDYDGENVTNFCHDGSGQNRDVTHSQQQNHSTEILKEGDNNTTPPETVTGECHEIRHEMAVVVDFLSVTGIPVTDTEVVRISPHVAEVLVLEIWNRDQTFEAIYDQARRLPLRRHDPSRSWEGLYISSVRGTPLGKPLGKPWGGPAGYESKQRDREKREAARQKREAEFAQIHAEAEIQRRQAEAEQQRYNALRDALTNEEREQVYDQAVSRLTKFDQDRVDSARRKGEPLGAVTASRVETEFRRIILHDHEHLQPGIDGANYAANGQV